MGISESDLKKYISSFFELLEQENIDNMNSIKKPKNLRIPNKKQDYVIIHESPSESDTISDKISYIAPVKEKEEIPIELVINNKKKYSLIFLKCEKEIEGYIVFYRDQQSNEVIQKKKLDTTNLTEIRGELEKILTGGIK
jgi:hypothetical protein